MKYHVELRCHVAPLEDDEFQTVSQTENVFMMIRMQFLLHLYNTYNTTLLLQYVIYK